MARTPTTFDPFNAVAERRVGRQRRYRVNAEQLKPIFDWVAPFERYWSESFDRLDDVLQEMKKEK